ncbi:unnamed protein product [Pleuronectes platessa]|uniref:Uncharacterized protein n=1 Tax=Pleuronectes platessa TaxID=8262 RepID=A0A9N7VIX9_PLEPL|nr:unnamed protein product [Pleuronectes platessa]
MAASVATASRTRKSNVWENSTLNIARKKTTCNKCRAELLSMDQDTSIRGGGLTSGDGGSCVALASDNGGGPRQRWQLMDPNQRQWTMTVDYSGSGLDAGATTTHFRSTDATDLQQVQKLTPRWTGAPGARCPSARVKPGEASRISRSAPHCPVLLRGDGEATPRGFPAAPRRWRVVNTELQQPAVSPPGPADTPESPRPRRSRFFGAASFKSLPSLTTLLLPRACG